MFSRPIVTGLLRGKLGFDGVVVTDALDAPAPDRDAACAGTRDRGGRRPAALHERRPPRTRLRGARSPTRSASAAARGADRARGRAHPGVEGAGSGRTLLEAEALERRFVAAPVRAHLDHQLEVDRVAEQRLDLGARARADLLDHRAALADDDLLLRLRLDEHVRAQRPCRRAPRPRPRSRAAPRRA